MKNYTMAFVNADGRRAMGRLQEPPRGRRPRGRHQMRNARIDNIRVHVVVSRPVFWAAPSGGEPFRARYEMPAMARTPVVPKAAL